jgi:enoyl-CoA hydratase
MTDILVQHDGPIATVVINRPAMRNAISFAMWTELARVTEELGQTDSVRAVVYRGAGTVAFASGADISEFKEQRKDVDSAARYNAATGSAYSTIRECPKPTIAMIFGFCMGGAMAVAMACDMRFAAEGSKFGIPAARLSIIYGADSVGQLVDLVGPAYAKDILYSARTRWRWASSSGSYRRPSSKPTPTVTCARLPRTRRCRCAAPRRRSSRTWRGSRTSGARSSGISR